MTWNSYETEPFVAQDLPRPPGLIAGAIVIADILALIPFAMDSKVLSWVGYVISAWLVAVLVIAFREVDRRRQSSPLYLPKPAMRWTVNIGALTGLVIGCLHAWRVAQEKSFA